MRVSELDILCVPGEQGAPADHWLNRWRRKLSTARLIHAPDADGARTALNVAARAPGRPKLLIGHSSGALAIAAAAGDLAGADVRGAVLVAVPAEAALRANAAAEALPWPCIMIFSRNDPLAPFAATQDLARAWKATLVDAGEAGRIDADSGYGPWPDGLLKLAAFLKTL